MSNSAAHEHIKHVHHPKTIYFAEHGTGALEITPLNETMLQETITPTFTSSSGPLLKMGTLHTSIDPSATDISKLLFDAHFVLSSGHGDSLFGTYSLTLSQFNSPTSETFAGLFTATGGTGAYAGYTGSGTFHGTNVYTDATGSSATSELSIAGLLTRTGGGMHHDMGPGTHGHGGHMFG